MPPPIATNVLDFILDKRAALLSLPTKKAAVVSGSKEMKVAACTPEATAFVIVKQSELISGLHLKLQETMKVAAALAESAMLVKDGVIDPTDVVEHARRVLAEGSVKLASLNDAFDQSPGKLFQGNASSQSSESGQVLDPLTSTLRSIG